MDINSMASSVVISAAQWIGSMLIQEAGAFHGVEDQVRDLQEELQLMQQYLQDADAHRQVGEIGALINQVRKLAYDSEDVIDSYILRVYVQAEQYGNDRSLVLLLPRLLGHLQCLSNARHIYKVGKQVQVIQKSLNHVRDRFSSYGLRRVTDLGAERAWKRQPRSYPYDDYDGDHVVGLEKHTQSLMKLLIGDTDNVVTVLSIVGMGGSGKTTLAKTLYNHPYTKDCFDRMAWVFISQEWSTQDVLSEILRKVSGPKENTQDLIARKPNVDELVDKLRSILENKSYFVVLDDVWNREALEEIFPALPMKSVDQRSRIIITTRNQEIIRFPLLQQKQYIHEVQPLDDEKAWELFSKIALNHLTTYDHESFRNLGKKMLKKCGGLPLAIVALSGILNSRSSIREWQQVNEALKSRLMDGRGSPLYGRVGDLLALSYDDLPYHLKSCFLYMGVFQEDCQIPTGMLMRMWIAEGLVPVSDEMSLEDIALQCLEELIHRFMVQVARTNFKGEIKAVRLHDLLRDICVRKAKEENFLRVYTADNEPITSDACSLAIQPRRAALHSCISLPKQGSHMRSLVLLAKSTIVSSDHVFQDMLDLRVLCQNLSLLRLLNLWGIKTPTGSLPDQIGGLIHLRYLGIRATNIIELPRSIGNLRNLLTLDYRNVKPNISNTSVKIPAVLWKLVKLRHLFLPIERPWNMGDLKLSTMANLQTLWGLKQEGGGQWFSREVPKLSRTLKKLMVIVSGEDDLKAAFSFPSLISDSINTFHCELKHNTPLRNVMALSNNQQLHKMTLIGEVKMKLSILLPVNIVMLDLKDSMLKDEDPMIVLGALAQLKCLKMSNSFLGFAFACEAGSFPRLQELYLHNFANLVTWRIEKGAMSCLKRLEIISCKMLTVFPPGLAHVTTLQKLEFIGSSEFRQQAKVYGWSQMYRLPHNFEAILEKCDSPVDFSSLRKLYELLTSGVFLNQKRKKFWVVKLDDSYCNCFLVYIEDISLATTVDIDGLPSWDTNADDWEFTEITERDGSIKVARQRSGAVRMVSMGGRLPIGYLSPSVTYTIAFVIRLGSSKFTQEISTQSVLLLPDQRPQTRKDKLDSKARDEWIKVSVGEFQTPPRVSGDAEFFLHCQWGQPSNAGFEIKCAIIEPTACKILSNPITQSGQP